MDMNMEKLTCSTCGQPAHIGPETNTFRHTNKPRAGSYADAPPDRRDMDTRKRCAVGGK